MQVNDLREMTLRLMRAENLSCAEAREFLSALINPAVTDAQVAAALAVLAVKGETVDELAGMAEAMRSAHFDCTPNTHVSSTPREPVRAR